MFLYSYIMACIRLNTVIQDTGQTVSHQTVTSSPIETEDKVIEETFSIIIIEV